MALMPELEDDSTEEKTLADRHTSVDVEPEHIQATFEYSITIPDEKAEELPERETPEGFACSLACSQAEKDYGLKFSVHDAVAQEDQYHTVGDDTTYNVLVRTSQNQ